MHILQLANFYGPNTGGLRVAIDHWAQRYIDRGNQVTLVVPGPTDSTEMVAGRRVITIRSPFVKGLGGYRAILNRRAVRRVIDELRPDVVELNDKLTLVGAAAHARRRGIPVVMFSHERADGVVGEVMPLARTVRRGIGLFNHQLSRRVDAIACASDYATGEFSWFTTPIHRVPLGVDLDTFRPPDDRSLCDRSAGERRSKTLRLVTVVRLSPEKRPDLLITTSIALVRRGVDHELVVIGDGPHRERLEAQAAHLPIRFRGHISDRDELVREVAAADIGIAPGPHETFGLGALEMMACGTPLVVPDHGALPELVDGDSGAVSARTGDAFADAITEIAEIEPELRRKWARTRAEDFTWEHSGDEMLKVFAGVTGRRLRDVGVPEYPLDDPI